MVVLRDKLLSENHADSFRISSLYADLTSRCMRPTTGVIGKYNGVGVVDRSAVVCIGESSARSPGGGTESAGGGTVGPYFHYLRTVCDYVAGDGDTSSRSGEQCVCVTLLSMHQSLWT